MNIKELKIGDLISIRETNNVYFVSLNDRDAENPQILNKLNKNCFVVVELKKLKTYEDGYIIFDLIIFNGQILNIYQAQSIEDEIIKIG